MESSNTYTHRFGERITIENTDRLIAEIGVRIGGPSVKRIVFDLVNVLECSSYGLRLFIIFQRKAEASGRELVLFRPSPVLRELLSTTRLDHVFKITDTLENGGA